MKIKLTKILFLDKILNIAINVKAKKKLYVRLNTLFMLSEFMIP